jgi:hypothetical protein
VGYELELLTILLSSKATQDPLLKHVLDPQPKKGNPDLLNADA